MNAHQPGDGRWTALVLAAGRGDRPDPVAQVQNKSHKCLVEVAGIAMIERVVGTLLNTGLFGKVLISIEARDVLDGLPRMPGWLAEGLVEVLPSAESLTDSVLMLADDPGLRWPLLITTADNVLHTPELVKGFVAQVGAADSEVSIGVTAEATVLAEYPQEGIGFFQFRDGGYSFCNLFAVHSPAGLEAARVFRGGGQFRKKPWRIVAVFGWLNLLAYRFRLSTLEASFRRIGRRLGVAVEVVQVPYAFAPIDVDNPRTLALSQRILAAREANN